MTPRLSLARPEAGEHDAAASGYVALAPSLEDAAAVLSAQRDRVVSVFSPLDEPRAAFRYAPDKWTTREVLGHLADAERIFAYRLLRTGRGDATPLPGFDENTYVPGGAFERRPLADVVGEWTAARNSTIALVRGMPPDAWMRRGVSNGQSVTARGLLYVIVGHVEHHLNVLRERYGLRAG
ncbi:MAG: DinB family protein [Acidobacteria bacterium]|nr:DinB family protein [Acidobacteriota bacterium]